MLWPAQHAATPTSQRWQTTTCWVCSLPQHVASGPAAPWTSWQTWPPQQTRTSRTGAAANVTSQRCVRVNCLLVVGERTAVVGQPATAGNKESTEQLLGLLAGCVCAETVAIGQQLPRQLCIFLSPRWRLSVVSACTTSHQHRVISLCLPFPASVHTSTTQVIASGFSKLSFKLGTPPSPQHQQPFGTGAFDPSGCGGGHPQHAQQQQRQASISPKQTLWLPGQLAHRAPSLQLPDSVQDCTMMDTQMSPPRWAPPQQQQQQQQPQYQQQFQKPTGAVGGATSPGVCTPSSTMGLFGAWSLQQQQELAAAPTAAGPQQQPQQHAVMAVVGGNSSHTNSRQPSVARSTPSPEPCLHYDAAAGEASSGAAAAAGGAGGGGLEAGAEGGGGGSPGGGSGGSSKPSGLPPLQTAKVLRAAEKQPASPSDLPAASLRKVALLRSLLARAEQQYQQQQTCFGGQQQQAAQQQPSRMQQAAPAAGGAFGGGILSAAAQQPQTQHQPGVGDGSNSSSSTPLWMQPWGASIPGGAGLSSSVGGGGGNSSSMGGFLSNPRHGGNSQQQQLQQQQHVLPPRPVTPWDMSSDDMDCSSASSVMDSDGSSSQHGPPLVDCLHGLLPPAGFAAATTAAAAGSGRRGASSGGGSGGGCQGDPHSAANAALLCEEVLGPEEPVGEAAGGGDGSSRGMCRSSSNADCMLTQPQEQRLGARARQQNMQLPFFQQGPCAATEGPAVGAAGARAGSPSHQHHHRRHRHHHQQERQEPGDSMLATGAAAPSEAAAAAARRGSSPELSRQKLEELRAKALASTSQLTCLTQEDMHSLQMGLASRRGSADSSSHTPSGLQQESTRTAAAAAAGAGAAPAGLRRHTVS